MSQKISIAIHGGAGTIAKASLTPALETQYLQGLQQALDAGYKILNQQGTSLDAVQAAVESLENCPLFNAGRGSVFTATGTHEMDASIMNGKTLEAGAVAGISGVKNPIILARDIMEHSGHVMLCGQGAFDYAKMRGLAFEADEYFYNEFRYQQWQAMKDTDNYSLDHSPSQTPLQEKKFGTVGAVALDAFGNVAAATSTGGMTNKKYGRLGDSPVIGAGNYANNNTCAISATGHGEYFLRAVVAYDISCLMEYKGYSLQQACQTVVLDKLVKFGGEGGVIALDTIGNVQLCYNSDGMYRGAKNNNGLDMVAIYADK